MSFSQSNRFILITRQVPNFQLFISCHFLLNLPAKPNAKSIKSANNAYLCTPQRQESAMRKPECVLKQLTQILPEPRKKTIRSLEICKHKKMTVKKKGSFERKQEFQDFRYTTCPGVNLTSSSKKSTERKINL